MVEMGRKRMATVSESTPVVFQVVSTDENLKRYSVKRGDVETKLVLPELSKTQEESVEIDGQTFVVNFDADEKKWVGDGIEISSTRGKGVVLPFVKPEGGFSTFSPENYNPAKHRTLQRVDFKDPWDYRLFRTKILLEHERSKAESEYREALKSIDDDFSEDIRVVRELANLSVEERNKKLAEVVKAAKKSASDKSFVTALMSGGKDKLADLLSQCAIKDDDKSKMAEMLQAALAALQAK